jgi:hypothetical protein
MDMHELFDARRKRQTNRQVHRAWIAGLHNLEPARRQVQVSVRHKSN